MKKFNKRLFGAMFTTLLMGLTACNGVKNVDPQPNDGGEYIVEKPSIAIRKLSSGTNSNDNPYVTFGYTITPSNASDRSIITTLSWLSYTGIADTDYYDSHIGDYLTVSVDESNTTITVTCLQAFSNQANLNITCAANSQCTTNVTIDYEVRLDEFNLAQAHLNATTSYVENGQTIQPWWSGTCSSMDTSNSSQWLLTSNEFRDYSSYNSSAKIFNFPFNSYKAAAAVYSYGSVDNVHETLSVSYAVTRVVCSSMIGLGASLESKLEQYFEDDVIPNCFEYTYMLASAFNSNASAWAATHLNASETSELHSKTFSLNFDINVTFSGSNGVSKTQAMQFAYWIDGRFFDVAVSSFALETDEGIVF